MTTEEIKNELRNHSEWLKDNNKGKRANFISRDLHGADFKDLNLIEVGFCFCNLSGAEFINCNLSKASFNLADLTNVSFFNCNLSGADLRTIKNSGVEFSDCEIVDAMFFNQSGNTIRKKVSPIRGVHYDVSGFCDNYLRGKV